jgi:hypothetical protein
LEESERYSYNRIHSQNECNTQSIIISSNKHVTSNLIQELEEEKNGGKITSIFKKKVDPKNIKAAIPLPMGPTQVHKMLRRAIIDRRETN